MSVAQDSAQALALLDAGLEATEIDALAAGFGKRLVDWHAHGAFTPDGRVFDIGGTTSTAINALRRGALPQTAGPAGERTLGNGSLMRAAPLALLAEGDALIEMALAQSRVTHGHAVAQVCCAVYLVWCRLLATGDGADGKARAAAAWTAAWRAVEEHVQSEEFTAALERICRELIGPIRGTGYVIHSLGAAYHLLTTRDSYESIVKGAIALGDDTDTTACIAGGAAGALYGVGSIPQRWMDAMKGTEMVESLLAALKTRV